MHFIMGVMIRKLLCLFVLFSTSTHLFCAELVIDPEASSVAVDVKASPPHTFTCDLQKYDAAVDFGPDGNVNSATFTFNLTDLETHNDSRNSKMLRWMNVEQYNTIQWTMKDVEVAGTDVVAHGELTMHGVTLPVDIPFTVVTEGDVVTISGTADFDYMDFDLPKIRLVIFTVNPDLHVHFKLQGRLAKAG